MTEPLPHSRRTSWSRGLVVTGIVIAVLNMALAWIMLFLGPSFQSGTLSTTSPLAPDVAQSSRVESDAKPPLPSNTAPRVPRIEDSTNSSNAMMANLFEVYQKMSQSEERQTTLLLGFCFALMSIGFSLFVMGIEGAADFKGDAKEFGSLAIKVSSPGILCIFFSSLLIALGIGGLSRSPPIQPESKADAVRAEFEGKEQVLRAEAQAKGDHMRAEADAKERLIEAETRAKKELIEAEIEATERRLSLEPAPRTKK
jgi:hypothetical protein